MGGAIFVLKADGELVEMRQEGYLTEAHLQRLLADYPRLLAGDQLNNAEPRRWVLVRQEAGLAGAEGGGDRWFLDHLFLDQEAIPTIIEVKRSSDTRIRREVVGQMLDYAANAVVYLPVDRIRSWFEDACGDRDPDEVLREQLGLSIEPEAFWAQAKTNLLAGRLRLVFVADSIPAELRRIVEFLNAQMNPAEVVAVEVQQYVGADGTRTLVPRVLGRTADAERVKGMGSARPAYEWDESSFFAALPAASPIERIARDLIAWAHDEGIRIVTNRTATPNLAWHLDAFGTFYPLFALDPRGKVYFQFGTLKNRPVLEDDDLRLALLRNLNTIKGIAIPEGRVSLYPSIPAEALARSGATQRFVQIWSETVGIVRQREAGRGAIPGSAR